MQVLAEETWSWLLLAEAAQHWLIVVCGSVGLYERCIQLDPSEVQYWQDHGAPALRQLSRRICGSPAAWTTRHLPDFGSRTDVTTAIARWRAAAASSTVDPPQL